MTRNTPLVRNGILMVDPSASQDHAPPAPIAIGSQEWFTWLEAAQTFAVDDPVGHFTARKKLRSGIYYWYAFIRRGGRYHETYLGKSADLGPERLRTIASRLEASARRSQPTAEPSGHGIRIGRSVSPMWSSLRLLPTKLAIPRLNPAQLVPTRALGHLGAALERPLTAISSPPGYGKTVLLAQWIATSQLPAAWVNLDLSDNDPARFCSYVCAALDQFVPGLLQTMWPLVQVPQLQIPNAVVTTLLAELSEAPNPTLLVLDDYHTIASDNSFLHEEVAFFVERLPPQVHLVLASRTEPPLPLAKLRIQGKVLELHAADLELSQEEAAHFLTHVMGLDLTASQVAALHGRAEGWIAGLQLAALAMQERPHTANWFAILLGDALGESRRLVDYLVEEVVQRLSADMRAFLLRAVLLDRLSAALCNAVTGASNGQAMLAAMERANLFLVPLDDHPQWYRFHGLFASALRHHVRENQPEILPEVYERASAWWEANGDYGSAIEYAFAGNDVRRAADLLDAAVEPSLERGYISLLLDTLARLPDEQVRERPRLCAAHAYVRFLRGDRAVFLRRIHDAQEAFAHADLQLNPSEHAILRGEILALSAVAGTILGQGTPREGISSLEQTHAFLPHGHPLRGFANAYVGFNQVLDGDAQAARGTLIALRRASEEKGDMLYVGMSLLFLGIATLLQGRLDDTLDLCGRAMRLVERYEDAALARVIHFLTGMVLYERNDLAGALDEASQGTVAHRARGAALFWGLPLIAYIHQAQGNTSAARRTMDENLTEWARLQADGSTYWAWGGRLLQAHQARLWILQGDLEAAAGWARSREHRRQNGNTDEALPPTYVREWEELVLARVYLAEGRIDDALDLLEELGNATQAGGRIARLLEVLVLQAIAFDAQDDPDEALQVLQRAVELAAPEGFIRALLDGGPVIRRLLALLMDREARRPTPSGREGRVAWRSYLEALLVVFGSEEQAISGTRWAMPGASGTRLRKGQLREEQPPAQSLTARELEVLRLIAGGASNKELARGLGIKLYTVKHHVQNIFTKLGVQSRTQAIARANTLHLLDTGPGDGSQGDGRSQESQDEPDDIVGGIPPAAGTVGDWLSDDTSPYAE